MDGEGVAEGKLLEGLVHPRDQQVQGDGLLGVEDHVVLGPQGLLLLKKVKMRGAQVRAMAKAVLRLAHSFFSFLFFFKMLVIFIGMIISMFFTIILTTTVFF